MNPATVEVAKNLKNVMVNKKKDSKKESENKPFFESELDIVQVSEKDLEELEQSLVEKKPVYPEFTLVIQDIEKEKDLEKIREVLSDPKLELNIEDIEAQLQKNKVVVSALSEVQGTLIIQRLKDIDADLRFDLSLKILPHFENILPKNLPIHPGNLAHLRKKIEEKKDPNFIVSTSSQIENFKVNRYLGIVTAEKIIGEKQKTDDVIEPLIHELILKAKNKGATAILGVNFDFKPYPDNKKLAFASATAVKLENKKK